MINKNIKLYLIQNVIIVDLHTMIINNTIKPKLKQI